MIKTRHFREEDLSAVAKLLYQATRRHCEREQSKFVEKTTEKIVKGCGARSTRIRFSFVAVKDEDVVGIISFTLKDGAVIEICPLIVSDDSRETDVANLLIEEMQKSQRQIRERLKNNFGTTKSKKRK